MKNKKLSLKKKVVSILDAEKLANIYGGADGRAREHTIYSCCNCTGHSSGGRADNNAKG